MYLVDYLEIYSVDYSLKKINLSFINPKTEPTATFFYVKIMSFNESINQLYKNLLPSHSLWSCRTPHQALQNGGTKGLHIVNKACLRTAT